MREVDNDVAWHQSKLINRWSLWMDLPWQRIKMEMEEMRIIVTTPFVILAETAISLFSRNRYETFTLNPELNETRPESRVIKVFYSFSFHFQRIALTSASRIFQEESRFTWENKERTGRSRETIKEVLEVMTNIVVNIHGRRKSWQEVTHQSL